MAAGKEKPMIIAVNIPINDYLNLPDCPQCNYSQSEVQQATKPRMSFSERVQNVTRQQAIDTWMNK